MLNIGSRTGGPEILIEGNREGQECLSLRVAKIAAIGQRKFKISPSKVDAGFGAINILFLERAGTKD